MKVIERGVYKPQNKKMKVILALIPPEIPS
jgi:hypothetical protein